ncbi:hypothetical protein ILUMI_12623 [Ignelater luminosus]|uniref:Uncharacterized protein n=1 Tax=Ignelater luminosus TaxID=2038154 RepID=A0A8K0GBL9_IGNLU|nr:hypothetical protein ILUMI_12623 [Ignelater luminosus]
MFYVKWVLIMGLIVILSRKAEADGYEIEKIIQNVPKEERLDFIRYYSAIGYEIYTGNTKTVDKNYKAVQFAELDSVSNFSTELYKWLIKTYDPKTAKLRKTARTRTFSGNVICFPNNQCIDIGDVGIHP